MGFFFFPIQLILYHIVMSKSSPWSLAMTRNGSERNEHQRAKCNNGCYESDVMEMLNVMGFWRQRNEKRNARNSSVARVCGEFCM